jgi:rhamnosyl/mannosyltransferase
LQKQAQALGLKNLHFVPEVTNEQKRSIMRAAYGFVFPSHIASEAFGIVLAEAAQQGTPMITCEIGTGTSYVNQDDETGLIVPPADAVAFGQAMDTFWNQPQQVAQWRVGALQRYKDNFMAETMAQKYVGVYRQLFAA